MACGGILLAPALAGGASGAGAPPAAAQSVPGGAGFQLAVAGVLALGLVLWRRWYRLDDAPPTAPLAPAAGLALFVGMLLAGAAGASVAARWLDVDAARAPGTLSELVGVIVGNAGGQALVLAAFLVIVRPRPQAGRRPVWRAALLGAVAFVFVWPMVAGASWLTSRVVEQFRDRPPETIAHETLQHLTQGAADPWFLAAVVLIVTVVPVLEEVMYRGALQRLLRSVDLGRWAAILVTSTVFALMHVGAARFHALPALFVLSIGMGWAYEKTGRLLAPITMHAAFNALNVVLALRVQPGG